jgi:hypothetical protein
VAGDVEEAAIAAGGFNLAGGGAGITVFHERRHIDNWQARRGSHASIIPGEIAEPR